MKTQIVFIERCLQPMVVGNCRAMEHRFHFDAAEGDCKLFVFGGCGGNDNRFNTIEECRKVCKPE